MSFNRNELAILTLIDSFISGDLAAPEFENQYSTSWCEYRDSDVSKNPVKDTQHYFDSVFSAVGSYYSDPDLLDEDTYSLDVTHPKGGHKARVFQLALGYNPTNSDVLANGCRHANIRR